MPEAPILEIRHLSKGFPGVRALAGVDFFLRRGEIHALMGENGAGKSTLIKVLTGVYPRDGGEILFEGRPFAAGSPHEAQEQGISTVYQEVNLVPNLSVAENLLLGRQPTRGGLIDGREMKRRAEAILKRLHLHVDVNQLLGDYSIAIQQMVAIGRALEFESKILILDEPTSSLDGGEVEQLFKVMRKLKAEGHAVLFVTHFVEQVYAVSDRITVLRNGELVGEFETARLPKVELISKLLGKALHDLERVATAKGEAPLSERVGEPVLRVQGLGKEGVLERFDLEIHAGGNQQKAIVARWLATQPSLLILDEPTRGIDVGAKAEIQKLIISLSDKGMAVLFISSELDEVLRCADRIAVLRDKAMVGKLSADQMDEQVIMRTIAHTDKVGAEPR